MEYITIGKDNINIMTKEEIIKRGNEKYKYNINKEQKPYKENLKYYGKDKIYLYLDNQKELKERLNKEPLPFCLFRFNELFDYNINKIGVKITEEQFMERLEVLLPIAFKYDFIKGYIVPECITSNIYEHIFKYKNKNYCVIMERKKNY